MSIVMCFYDDLLVVYQCVFCFVLGIMYTVLFGVLVS